MILSDRLEKKKVLILLFHGVVPEHRFQVRNYIRKHLDIERFKEVLDDLQKYGNAMSMDDIVSCKMDNIDYPDYSYAITFDDGFENNYSIAADILVDRKLPACFYITSGFVEHQWMSWTDRIEYALETIDADFPSCLVWNEKSYPLTTVSQRISFIKDLRNYVFSNLECDTSTLVYNILRDLRRPSITNSTDPLDKKLSPKQVRTLANTKGFLVGGHTHSHAIMSLLNSEDLKNEIDFNLDRLKKWIGKDVIHFAYPQGQANHYSDNVITELKKREIVCCPTAIDGNNSVAESLFDLKRVFVV